MIPTQLGYKNVKWVSRLEVTDKPAEGYWEQRGYPRDAPSDAADEAAQAVAGPGPRRPSYQTTPGNGRRQCRCQLGWQ